MKEALDLLRFFGFDRIEHDSHVPFLSHLIGTRRTLAQWGCDAELRAAGLFHSVYGTEFYATDPAHAPERSVVRGLIGDRAERLVWLWCSIRRDTIDPDLGTVRLRQGGRVDLTPLELCDIATLWIADTVEQIRRMAPHERNFARGLSRVVDHATPEAQLAFASLTPWLPAPGGP